MGVGGKKVKTGSGLTPVPEDAYPMPRGSAARARYRRARDMAIMRGRDTFRPYPGARTRVRVKDPLAEVLVRRNRRRRELAIEYGLMGYPPLDPATPYTGRPRDTVRLPPKDRARARENAAALAAAGKLDHHLTGLPLGSPELSMWFRIMEREESESRRAGRIGKRESEYVMPIPAAQGVGPRRDFRDQFAAGAPGQQTGNELPTKIDGVRGWPAFRIPSPLSKYIPDVTGPRGALRGVRLAALLAAGATLGYLVAALIWRIILIGFLCMCGTRGSEEPQEEKPGRAPLEWTLLPNDGLGPQPLGLTSNWK